MTKADIEIPSTSTLVKEGWERSPYVFKCASLQWSEVFFSDLEGKPQSCASGQYPWVRASIFTQAGLLRKPVWFMEAQEIAVFQKPCATNLLPAAQSHENNCLNAKCNLVTRPKAPHLWSDWSPSCICEWFPWLHGPEREAPAVFLGERCPVLPQEHRAEVAEEEEASPAWSTRDKQRKWLRTVCEGINSEEELAKAPRIWFGLGPRRS